jgi:hypothetical protein
MSTVIQTAVVRSLTRIESPLLALPGEIRDLIWEYWICNPTEVKMRLFPIPMHLGPVEKHHHGRALLLVNRQITTEVKAVQARMVYHPCYIQLFSGKNYFSLSSIRLLKADLDYLSRVRNINVAGLNSALPQLQELILTSSTLTPEYFNSAVYISVSGVRLRDFIPGEPGEAAKNWPLSDFHEHISQPDVGRLYKEKVRNSARFQTACICATQLVPLPGDRFYKVSIVETRGRSHRSNHALVNAFCTALETSS